MDKPVTVIWPITKYVAGELQQLKDEVVTEFPLTIKLDREEFATIVCTPTDLEDMVIGFLASEGIIRSLSELHCLSIDDSRGIAEVELVNKQSTAKDWVNKRFIGSCCGKSRQFYYHNDARTAKTIPVGSAMVTAEQCLELMRQLQQASPEFQSTGGVHNAALCDNEGMLTTRTDIGRHNALDKIYGYCIRKHIPLKGKIITFSGRVSSEVLLKIAKIGAGIILSKSAPTQLALQLADELGITVVGFIRGQSFNIYTHPERIHG
ncbi:formate dehydrogenase accessory sulfurtransferase FdhD [Paenibacillus radicis (ex Xue et al. 2023)]|uniref:Sulfur carrier protein FdhD n=1 Tax=Paenibacillus radicis (ex Xue et al. 2023) TaxID=2972489 RepID=A0ABT1YDJ9_9BACL|nr:formate dehydrogenase accessory sulfurtransferase FdhD [Paenibacillus radicis (ex Xue et al. 2023)]MCR8631017.1 formate dehydrogenase accessory sulfurtransferase FdhD [Paenibacillus radicis (ex Xue et al. 2023)]